MSIPEFELVKPLGEGTFSFVRLCLVNGTLKVVKYALVNRISKWVRTIHQRIPLEVSIMLQLKHPNVIQLEEYFVDEFFCYMVLEYLPSIDLFEYIERTRVDEADIKMIFGQVVSAIGYIHDQGIVHLDIKHENVLVGERICVIDFGSARYIKEGPFLKYYGTSLYEPPEILRGEPYSGVEQDVWQLGVLLYILMYHQNPFQNEDEILRCEYAIGEGYSDSLVQLLQSLLVLDPSKRLLTRKIQLHPWFNTL
jgi:serine/threonine protein kinase